MSDRREVPPPGGPPPRGGPPPLQAPRPLGSEPEEAHQPVPAPPEPESHALHHVTEITRTYPCTQCGGELEFHIGEQRLACPHCGNVQELVEVRDRALSGKRDLRRAVAELRRNPDAGPQIAGEKEVVCQNCGGHTTFTGTLTSTRCPYCATPIQRDDVHDAPARLAVDGVLPFQIDERAAKAALDTWVSSRWFAPNEFKTYSRTGSFTSVYAAYFSYDADTSTRYRGQRGDNYTVTVGSGENQRTEVRTRWRSASGRVHNTFTDLTVLANDGLDRGHVTALEPWPMQQVQPFSPEYVAGHLCRTYDHDVEACFGEAEQRMDAHIDTTIRRDIGGDHQRITSKETIFSSLTFAHLLLPIWLLTVIYDGKPFQVVINGATGEVHGQRPYSTVKIAAAATAALIVALVVFVVYRSS